MLNAFNTWTEKNTPAEFLRIPKRLMKIECKPFCFAQPAFRNAAPILMGLKIGNLKHLLISIRLAESRKQI